MRVSLVIFLIMLCLFFRQSFPLMHRGIMEICAILSGNPNGCRVCLEKD